MTANGRAFLEESEMKLVTSRTGSLLLGLSVLLAAMRLGMILSSAPTADAQTAPSVAIKQITLTPGEEVPAVTVNAIGYFSGTLTDGNLEFDLSAVGPSITASHIHLGAKGTNGPAIAFLFGPADPGVGAIHPTGNIKVANLVGPLAGNWKGFTDAMAKGELYVNVHSTANPGGVVRAQIPATTLAPLPPNTGETAPVAGSGFNLMQVGGILLLVAAGGVSVMLYSTRRSS
jgi:hypothetical protein